MRWYPKNFGLKYGDKKKKRKFAFLPTEMKYHQIVWLEHYEETYEWTRRSDGKRFWYLIDRRPIDPEPTDSDPVDPA